MQSLQMHMFSIKIGGVRLLDYFKYICDKTAVILNFCDLYLIWIDFAWAITSFLRATSTRKNITALVKYIPMLIWTILNICKIDYKSIDHIGLLIDWIKSFNNDPLNT